jgi:hypothetical protein
MPRRNNRYTIEPGETRCLNIPNAKVTAKELAYFQKAYAAARIANDYASMGDAVRRGLVAIGLLPTSVIDHG